VRDGRYRATDELKYELEEDERARNASLASIKSLRYGWAVSVVDVDKKLCASQLVYMIATKFQRLHPCFRGPATRIGYWEYRPMSGRDLNQRWRPLTGST